MAPPVVNELGVVTSVVCASIGLDWVTGFIERSGLPPSTVLTVLDAEGMVQYRSADLEKYVGKHAGAWATALDTAGSVRGFAGLDGVERLYVAEPLEFRGQRTGTRVTLGIALAPYRRRAECRAPQQHRPSDDRDAPVLPDCLGCRRGAVPA